LLQVIPVQNGRKIRKVSTVEAFLPKLFPEIPIPTDDDKVVPSRVSEVKLHGPPKGRRGFSLATSIGGCWWLKKSEKTAFCMLFSYKNS
jgi:hypothetical protein